MDQILTSKWFPGVISAFAVGYLWMHSELLNSACRMLNVDWWH